MSRLGGMLMLCVFAPRSLSRQARWGGVAVSRLPRGVASLALLARALGPTGTRSLSAGSHPTQVRSEAVDVLLELGIDIREQRSNGLDEVDLDEVDVVFTLCAEEECPVLPGTVERIAWPLPDPAAAPPGERLPAFRAARDEIRDRLEAFFAERR